MKLRGFWRLLRFYLRRELDNLIRNNVRLCAIGRIESLPEYIQTELRVVTEKTARNRGMQLNLALNYGGRGELVDAIKAMVESARSQGTLHALDITEERIASHLYTAGLPDPDLLIRTSGEMRISNFLLWQIAYAELYVTDTLWPDFSRTELLEAVLVYQNRDRRFGGVGPLTPLRMEEPHLVLENVEVPSY